MLYIHFAHVQGFIVSMSYIKRKFDVITESAGPGEAVPIPGCISGSGLTEHLSRPISPLLLIVLFSNCPPCII